MAIPPPPGFNNRKDPRLQPAPEVVVVPPDPFVAEDTEQLLDTEIEFFLMKNLTESQRKDPSVPRYIVEYFKCRNNAQAARAAGLTSDQGRRLLNRAEIHRCIQDMTSKQLMKYAYDEEEVMARIKEIGEVDPIEIQNPDGSFKTRFADIKPEIRRAIKKFKAKNIYKNDVNGVPEFHGVLLEVEFWDKIKAVELLGIEKNLLKKTTKVEHTVSAKMADILLESGNRADQHRLQAARPVNEIEGRIDGPAEGNSADGADVHRDAEHVE